METRSLKSIWKLLALRDIVIYPATYLMTWVARDIKHFCNAT